MLAQVRISSHSSICSPQPDQVGFLHLLQVTFTHIIISYLALERCVINKIKLKEAAKARRSVDDPLLGIRTRKANTAP